MCGCSPDTVWLGAEDSTQTGGPKPTLSAPRIPLSEGASARLGTGLASAGCLRIPEEKTVSRKNLWTEPGVAIEALDPSCAPTWPGSAVGVSVGGRVCVSAGTTVGEWMG